MKNKSGGGKNANINGLNFEQETKMKSALEKSGATLKIKIKTTKKNKVYDVTLNDKKFILASQTALDTYLDSKGVNELEINSKKWQPDECVILEDKKKVYIVEKKFQNSSGSVDEKITNFDFKLEQYSKLFEAIDKSFEVEMIYIFSDWFKDSRYTDMLDYLKRHNIKYFFNTLPLREIGL